MPAYFTDSSAAVKRYLTETGSAWMRGLFLAKPPNEFYAVAIISVEVVAAITRRARGGMISKPNAARLCGVFLFDLDLDFEVVEVTETLLSQAVTFVRTYSLRGYDAVQLAAATEVNRSRLAASLSPLIFISADTELNAAAQSEGLTVEDPNAHP